MHGIHTALVTPFAADGRVDVDVFVALCERQMQAGVHGLVVCGTTGETPTLSVDERARLLAATLELAEGRDVTVTMGVGSNCTATTVRATEAAKAAGAHAGLVVLPYYNKPNPRGLLAHVRAVAEVGLPVVLYHVPGRTGQRVDLPVLAELCSVPGVVAVKEATGDLGYATGLVASTEVPVLSGDDFTFLGLMAQGGTGCISVVSNVAPAQTVAVYDRLLAGDVKGARAAFSGLWPLIGWLFDDTNPVPAKAAMAELGLCRADVRLPLAPYEGRPAASMLADLGLMSRPCG